MKAHCGCPWWKESLGLYMLDLLNQFSGRRGNLQPSTVTSKLDYHHELLQANKPSFRHCTLHPGRVTMMNTVTSMPNIVLELAFLHIRGFRSCQNTCAVVC